MTETAIRPLRRRMIEDMTVRNFVETMQSDYIRHVKNLTAFLGRSPDTATVGGGEGSIQDGADRRRATSALGSATETPVELSRRAGQSGPGLSRRRLRRCCA